MSGWYPMFREDTSNPVLIDDEPFTRAQAWQWLCENAAWKDTRHRVGKVICDVPRGSLFVTQRELQKVWKWRSLHRVQDFLDALQNEGMIGVSNGTEKGSRKGHITICKYTAFHEDENKKGSAKGQERVTKGTIEQVNKEQIPYIKVDDNHIGESTITRLQRVKSLNEYEKQLVDMGVSESLLAEWNAVRSRKKAPRISETVIKSLTRESTIANYTIRKAIEECVARSWVGFKAEWVKTKNQTNEKTSLFHAFETIINGDDQNDYGLN
jgi:hypothetical protein